MRCRATENPRRAWLSGSRRNCARCACRRNRSCSWAQTVTPRHNLTLSSGIAAKHPASAPCILPQRQGLSIVPKTFALIYTMHMHTPTATAEYMKLSVSERIQLVEDIWDSIAAEAPDTVGLSQIQRAELHRRVAAHRADPSTAVPWEQVRSKLFPSKP